MTLVIEGSRSIRLGTPAALIEEDRELAWAEKYVVTNPDVRWIIGNYVEADNANSNGHIFPLEHLKAQQASIAHKPLNVLHRPHQIVGAFVASEMMYPTEAAAEDNPPAPGSGMVRCAKCGTSYEKDKGACPECGATAVKDAGPFSDVARDPDAEAQMAAFTTNPKVEALSVFWKYYFPDLYDTVQRAHAEGNLYYSMECVPQTVGCTEGACLQEFAYMGKRHETYCEHLNAPGARKVLNKPQFTAGALIIPPVRPGWKNADITEVSKLIEASDEAEAVYEHMRRGFPHLDAAEWEQLMALVVAASA